MRSNQAPTGNPFVSSRLRILILRRCCILVTICIKKQLSKLSIMHLCVFFLPRTFFSFNAPSLPPPCSTLPSVSGKSLNRLVAVQTQADTVSHRILSIGLFLPPCPTPTKVTSLGSCPPPPIEEVGPGQSQTDSVCGIKYCS